MPIESSFQMPKSEKKEFVAIEADVYESSVKEIENKISFYKNDDGTDKEILNFTFEVSEGQHKGRRLWKEVSPYCFYGAKGASVLLTIVNAIEKRDLTPEETDGIGADYINSLIGKNIRLTVSKEPGKDGTPKNKVKGFLPSKLAPVDFKSVAETNAPDFLTP